MKKRNKKNKELNIMNFYGVLSFVSMIIFIIFAIINKKYEADTFAFNLINVVSAIGFVVSVVYAIYSLCSTVKINEYGAILSIITLMIISGTIVSLYYLSTVNQSNNEVTDVDVALKCASSSECSIESDGTYSCKIDNTTVKCPNKWHKYYKVSNN